MLERVVATSTWPCATQDCIRLDEPGDWVRPPVLRVGVVDAPLVTVIEDEEALPSG
jgi:hypothetical protein